ncbi:MmgE/PrpD family protein [Halorubrum trueperi]|uniref:MmgE/PrpD family protein n=1 Tax=Halorubrum trueperi TaxID=2004704 RepID=A0ABD5UGB9_9EURY
MDAATADAATILGVGTERPPAERALHTGTASHALDYDDLAWAMDGHPSVTLVPPLLALAPEVDASGRDLITAFAAGFKAGCALGATAAVASLCDLSATRA